MSCLGTDSEYNFVLHLFSSDSFLTEGYQKNPLPHGMYNNIRTPTRLFAVSIYRIVLLCVMIADVANSRLIGYCWFADVLTWLAARCTWYAMASSTACTRLSALEGQSGQNDVIVCGTNTRHRQGDVVFFGGDVQVWSTVTISIQCDKGNILDVFEEDVEISSGKGH